MIDERRRNAPTSSSRTLSTDFPGTSGLQRPGWSTSAGGRYGDHLQCLCISRLTRSFQMCVADNKLGNEDAVFHTAAVWVWNSNLETGNFVPAGEAVQSKIPEARLCVAMNVLGFTSSCSTDNTIQTHCVRSRTRSILLMIRPYTTPKR